MAISFEQSLKRLEASHVQLMTDHEIAWKEHLEFVEQQDEAWARHKEWLKKYEEQQEVEREIARRRGEDLDQRIADLVSGIGEYIRSSKSTK